jgi:hypothetical protein
MASRNVKSSQIEKNGHAPLQLKGHVKVKVFLQSALSEGDIPDMLAN